MGNGGSYISTSETTSSSRGSSSSTFEMIRQMSYESDVFYPDSKDQRHISPQPGMAYEKPGLPDLTPENFPAWRINDMNPMLLKYMKRSYQPCPETFKDSAKKLAELAAAQKIPKFVSSFGGSQCMKLHWACLAGWCMCRYQYQPMTPLHLMPHTRLTSGNVIRRTSLPSSSPTGDSSSSDTTIANDVITRSKIVLYDDKISNFHQEDLLADDATIDILAKETTV